MNAIVYKDFSDFTDEMHRRGFGDLLLIGTSAQ